MTNLKRILGGKQVVGLLVGLCVGVAGCETPNSGVSNGVSDKALEQREFPAPLKGVDVPAESFTRSYIKGRVVVKLKAGADPLQASSASSGAYGSQRSSRYTALRSALAEAKPMANGLRVIDFAELPNSLPLEGQATSRLSSTFVANSSTPTRRKNVIQERVFLGADRLQVTPVEAESVSLGGQITDMSEVMDYLSSPALSDVVEYVGREYIYQPVHNVFQSSAPVPSDTYAGYQWHYGPAAEGGAGFTEYWQAFGAGRADDAKQIVVAVIDSGQIYDHPDVSQRNMLKGYDFIDSPNNGDGDGRDADATDPGDGVAADFCFEGSRAARDSWHGSHVSGTIGAAKSDNGMGVASGAWGVKILPIRALGQCGGSSLDIADAIDWAVLTEDDPLLPPKPERPADIINLSLGGPSDTCDRFQQDAINRARAAGAIVVVAAGNSGIDARRFTPANCEGVITVAASDAQSVRSYYSNYGDVVDIMAPGGDTSADKNGDGYGDGVLSIVKDSYSFFQGTSMAAPHVAAAAALVWSANPQMSSFQVENFLKYSGRPISSTSCGGVGRCGQSHLDLSAALKK